MRKIAKLRKIADLNPAPPCPAPPAAWAWDKLCESEGAGSGSGPGIRGGVGCGRRDPKALGMGVGWGGQDVGHTGGEDVAELRIRVLVHPRRRGDREVAPGGPGGLEVDGEDLARGRPESLWQWGGGGLVRRLWCVLVCSCRRQVADRHFLPFPWTLCQGCIGPPRRPQKRLGRRLEGVAKAVGGGYCRLQMPLKLAFAVRETVAGHRLGALEGGGGGAFQCIRALSLCRRRCPSASHHLVPSLFLPGLSFPLHFPFLSLGRLCQRSPRTVRVSLLSGPHGGGQRPSPWQCGGAGQVGRGPPSAPRPKPTPEPKPTPPQGSP